MAGDLNQQTVNALQWDFLRQFGLQGINLLVLVLLSRILDPNDFGLLAMVMVLTRLCQIFVDFGLGAALIQKDQPSASDISFVFCFNLLASTIVALGLVFAAPGIAWFYDKPILESITFFVAANFIVAASFIVQRSLLQKSLKFKTMFFVELSAACIAGIVAVIFALSGYGVWSLVAKLLTTSIVLGIAYWFCNPWLPAWNLDFRKGKSLVKFSLPLTGNQVLNYFARNLDTILVGKYWGDTQLGYYDKAYSLMLVPLNNVSSVVSRVMFPTLSKIQGNLPESQRLYLKAISIVSFVTFPLSIGLLACSETVVLSVLGEKWLESAKIIQILAILGFTQSISRLNGAVFQSQGKTMLQFKWGLLVKAVVISAVIVGVQYGAVETAIFYVSARPPMILPTLAVVGGTIQLRLGTILKQILPTVGTSILVGAVLLLLDRVVMPNSWPVIKLSVELIVATGLYALIGWRLRLEAFQDLLEFARSRRNQSRPGVKKEGSDQ